MPLAEAARIAVEVGQFLSVDPVGVDPTGGANFNRYWYGNDNPYKFVDPDGRLACLGSLTEDECLRGVADKEGCIRTCLDGARASETQRKVVSELDVRAVRGSDKNKESFFFLNDDGEILSVSQRRCSADGCTRERSDIPEGTTMSGHSHTLAVPIDRRRLQSKGQKVSNQARLIPGPGDAAPLVWNLPHLVVLPDDSVYLIEGTPTQAMATFVKGPDASFGAFVGEKWHGKITFEDVDSLALEWLNSNTTK